MNLFDQVDKFSSKVLLTYCDISGAGLRAILSSSPSISDTSSSRIKQDRVVIPLATANFIEYPFEDLRPVFDGHELMTVTNYTFSSKDATERNEENVQNHINMKEPILTCITLNTVIPEDLGIDLAQQIITELYRRGVENIQVLSSQALKGVSLPIPKAKKENEAESEQVYIASNASSTEINNIYSVPIETENNETSSYRKNIYVDPLSNVISEIYPHLDGATKLYDPFICALITIARVMKTKVIVFTCYGYKMRSINPEADETNVAIKALGTVIERITKNILRFDYLTATKLKFLIPIRTLFASEVNIDSFFDLKSTKEHSSWARNDGFRTHL